MSTHLPILVSFSGGRTSAFMAQFLKTYYENSNQKLVFIYANTGKELESTLEFVNKCDNEWNLGITWVEAVVTHKKGIGVKFKIVDFKTASRKGQPFEEVIKKYGIPNLGFPHCTRELKQIPIKKYMQSLGYKEWLTAVGIRADEPHRINRGADSNFINPFFPLGGDIIRVDEKFIREWWDRQSFDLDLKDYQNNCDLCWKKSKRKRLTMIAEDPSSADWWEDMEAKYGGEYQFDQREGLTISHLVELSKQPFQKAQDKHELRKQQATLFEPDMDMEWDCMCKST